MTSRIPYSAKGKGLAREEPSPPRKRIRIQAPDLDTSDLIQENSLTLIGRLTNPAVQRLWSLIPFLSNRWNLKGKAIGSDLGRGLFQFRFDFEEDIQKVLENRPYHFDQWMVILQRWEPIISPSFPSKIPFWIQLDGLPLHYWKPTMLKSIGEQLGEYVKQDLTPTTAMIQVLIDGLKPLIMETVIDFADGSEALVTLTYKKLRGHCFYCFRLSHEEKDCTEKPAPKESSRHTASPSKTKELQNSNHNNHASQRTKRTYSAREETARSQSDWRQRDYRGASHRERSAQERNRNSGEGSRDLRERLQNTTRSARSSQNQHLQWREKTNTRDNFRQDSSENSRTRRPPLEREYEVAAPPPTLQTPHTTEQVMGELREVTVQYTSCVDPTESAARKQRVLQGEARGLMANTAAQIIAATTGANHGENLTLELPAITSDPDQDTAVLDIPLRAEIPITATLFKTHQKREVLLVKVSPLVEEMNLGTERAHESTHSNHPQKQAAQERKHYKSQKRPDQIQKWDLKQSLFQQ
ncbi:unnamed protein product [Arabidopsis thaliana]|uniref:(thale cress) hypothetical protein n=1 Tax=Arabidopsis thaliana TaxID=3702 RepID=A0A7G2F5W4_ARATH|nr:unnamed protein product [Arabidopsis thaliana]